MSPDLVESISNLAATSESPEQYRDALREILATGGAESRLLAMWIVRSSLWPDDELRTLAISRYDSESKTTAAAAVDFAVSGPLDEPAQAVIREALAVRVMSNGCGRSNGLEIVARRQRCSPTMCGRCWGPTRRLMSAVPYFQITGDGETAARALLRFLREEERAGDGSVIQKLGRIGWFDEAVLAVLRRRLDADAGHTRLAAAATLLRLGVPVGFDKAQLTRAAAEAAMRSMAG